MRPIDHFLNLVGAAVTASAAGAARSAASRVTSLLAAPAEPADPAPAQRLGVCRFLDTARTLMRPDLAQAFAAVEPALAWQTRTMANGAPNFAEGHAGARVLDRNGLERRGGLVAGISLVAPGVTYPEHDHPPEEIYLVLSGGEWWQAGGTWRAPGPGGIVHNPPGIRHAMRGTSVPLLAIWFLLPP